MTQKGPLFSRYVFPTGKKKRLEDFDPSDTGGLTDKASVEEKMRSDLKSLSELQAIMYAAATHGVLVVLQGVDTAGKDGTIRHVFSGVNPQSCRVASFKKPTELELSHDYLWRVHAVCPARGEMVVFNRSHYESILVERVHSLVPKAVWSRRYEQILSFEELIQRSGTIVIKLFLNLSKAEQKERLLAREADPTKRWKVNPADWEERKLWDDYREAYDAMLRKTSTDASPWIVVPSDAKWYRNTVVLDAIISRLEGHRTEWERAVEKRGAAVMAGSDEA